VSKRKKLLEKLIAGNQDKAFSFDEAELLLLQAGFVHAAAMAAIEFTGTRTAAGWSLPSTARPLRRHISDKSEAC
jgi:hypothetical protein